MATKAKQQSKTMSGVLPYLAAQHRRRAVASAKAAGAAAGLDVSTWKKADAALRRLRAERDNLIDEYLSKKPAADKQRNRKRVEDLLARMNKNPGAGEAIHGALRAVCVEAEVARATKGRRWWLMQQWAAAAGCRAVPAAAAKKTRTGRKPCGAPEPGDGDIDFSKI